MLYVVSCVVTIVILSFVLRDHFLKTADLIQVSSRAQKAVIESAYFLKKLEISHFSEEETPFEFERDSDIWYDLALEHCSKLKERVNIVYKNMSSIQKVSFLEETVDLVVQKNDVGELANVDDDSSNYKLERYPLIDGVGAFSDLCVQVLTREDVYWQVNTSDPDYRPISQEREFYSVMLSESELSKGLNNMIHSLLTLEFNTSVVYMCVFMVLPSLSAILLILNCCCCCYFQTLQRKSFRGFLLIPKHQVRKIVMHHSKKVTIQEMPSTEDTSDKKRKSVNLTPGSPRTHNSYTAPTNLTTCGSVHGGGDRADDPNMTNFKGESSSSTVLTRLDIARVSVIQRFFWRICFVTIISFAAFLALGIVGVLTCDRFNTRNIEYHLVLKVESDLYHVNMFAVNYLYPNQSEYEPSYTKSIVEEKLKGLMDVYNVLRFGEHYEGYEKYKTMNGENEHEHATSFGGNDGEVTTHKVYYDKYCDPDEVEGEFEKLNCESMNSKMEALRKSVVEIVEAEITDISSYQQLRSSNAYKILNMVVNYSNDTIFDTGTINVDYKVLEEHAKHLVDVYNTTLVTLSLLLIILFLPLIAGYMCWTFYPSLKALNRNLSMSKQMMLYMDTETLNTPNIYDYILTKDGDGLGGLKFSFFGSGGGFGKLYSQEKKDRLNVYADVLEMSSYGVIAFDRLLDIVHSNNSSEELFRVRSSDAKNLADIFDRESIVKVRRWMRRRLKNSFSGELCAVYNSAGRNLSKEQKYPVHADISRSDLHSNVFIGLFENLESTKKKDLLRNTERRGKSLELLMEHILPSEIAAGAQIQDFLEGSECRVYQHKRATAYFGDICNFSSFSRYTSPETVIGILHLLFSKIDDLCQKHGLEKIKTIGDCYFCVSGIPTYRPLHAVSAMEFAIDVLSMMKEFNEGEYREIMEDEREKIMEEEGGSGEASKQKDYGEIEIRTGLGSGPLNAAVIGKIKKCYDVWGEMVNEAARMESHGTPGKIMVTRATFESLFGRYDFMERKVHLQGIGTNVLAYVHTPKLSGRKSSRSQKSASVPASSRSVSSTEKKIEKKKKLGVVVVKPVNSKEEEEEEEEKMAIGEIEEKDGELDDGKLKEKKEKVEEEIEAEVEVEGEEEEEEEIEEEEEEEIEEESEDVDCGKEMKSKEAEVEV